MIKIVGSIIVKWAEMDKILTKIKNNVTLISYSQAERIDYS